jgi:hypothetical protein
MNPNRRILFPIGASAFIGFLKKVGNKPRTGASNSYSRSIPRAESRHLSKKSTSGLPGEPGFL